MENDWQVIEGDCIDILARMDPCSVDSIVTDPPYGIAFMGKKWDSSSPGIDFTSAAMRVLKPGGHLIAFAATRTCHHLAVALEDSGFEIRDQIGWLQWQGFPKSHDVSKAIDRAAGAEREVVGTVKGMGKQNPEWNGTAQGRAENSFKPEYEATAPATEDAQKWEGWGTALKPSYEPAILARKPLEGTVAANVLKYGTGGVNIDACRIPPGDKSWPGPSSDLGHDRWPANIYHCTKPSRGEREAGCGGLPESKPIHGKRNTPGGLGVSNAKNEVHNHHPTVKPINLMRWLVRLVTPPGGLCLDPFLGSGSTGIAAILEGFKFRGVELSHDYCEIARARISHNERQNKQ